MAAKGEKISDIKKAGRVSAEPTSRPLIVTNRPVMTSDPMVVSSASEPATAPETPKTSVTSRTERVIKPVSDMSVVTQDEKPAIEASPVASAETTPAVLEALAPSKDLTTETEVPAESAVSSDTTDSPDFADDTHDTTEADEPGPAEPKRDSAAEQANAEAEAEEALSERDQQIELLITSGKYNVPINAVQRKRSRIFVAILCVLALVLALILLDAALDAGLVDLPVSVPHTKFFSQH